jgi:DNA-binding GntR family transcriptional regulator
MTNLKKGNLVDQAHHALRKKIITLEIKPGEYLDEKALMKEMGIGRTPLRQAILLLRNENFIEGQPHRSPYVREYSLAEMKELFETLVIVEKNATYLAALRINDRELDKVKKAHSILESAIQNKNYWEITDHNLEFHYLIAEASKNRFLCRMHQNIRMQAERLSYIAVSRELGETANLEEHNQKISKQHNALIKCLENHDVKQIGSICVEHVRLFQNRILQSFMDISYA